MSTQNAGASERRTLTMKERQQAARQNKLDEIAEQVSSGALVVRQMDPAERAAFVPRAPKRRPR